MKVPKTAPLAKPYEATSDNVDDDPLMRPGKRERRVDEENTMKEVINSPDYPNDIDFWEFLKIIKIPSTTIARYKEKKKEEGVLWASPKFIAALMNAFGITSCKRFMLCNRSHYATGEGWLLKMAIFNLIVEHREIVHGESGDQPDQAVNIYDLFWQYAPQAIKQLARENPAALEYAFETWCRDGELRRVGNDRKHYIINLKWRKDIEKLARAAYRDFQYILMDELAACIADNKPPHLQASVHANLAIQIKILRAKVRYGMEFRNERRSLYESLAYQLAGSLGFDSGQRYSRCDIPFLQLRYLLRILHRDNEAAYHDAIADINKASLEKLEEIVDIFDPETPSDLDIGRLTDLFEMDLYLFREHYKQIDDVKAELIKTRVMHSTGTIRPAYLLTVPPGV